MHRAHTYTVYPTLKKKKQQKKKTVEFYYLLKI